MQRLRDLENKEATLAFREKSLQEAQHKMTVQAVDLEQKEKSLTIKLREAEEHSKKIQRLLNDRDREVSILREHLANGSLLPQSKVPLDDKKVKKTYKFYFFR